MLELYTLGIYESAFGNPVRVINDNNRDVHVHNFTTLQCVVLV